MTPTNGAQARDVLSPSLSFEYVEVVERGDKRIVYPTEEFLQSCPVNLSRNCKLRVVFGFSYHI